MRAFLLLLLGLSLLSLVGCASTEPENMAATPWNRPTNWESGLPSGMTEGR